METKAERQIAALTEVIDGLITDTLAHKLLIRALIATHPEPAAAKAAFQVLLSASEAALPDAGIGLGIPAEVLLPARQRLAQVASSWLADFPPSRPTGTPGRA